MKLDINALTAIAYAAMQTVGEAYEVKKPTWADLEEPAKAALRVTAAAIVDKPESRDGRSDLALFAEAKTKPEQVMAKVFAIVVADGRFYLN